MATEPQTTAPDSDSEEEGRTRLPRVVVRMSDAMFAALKEWCEAQSPAVVPTQLGRDLIARQIGWDLSKDPDAPGGATRTKYTDDASREAGKLRNRKQATLLRAGLYQAHQGQIKGKPALVTAAQAVVMELAGGKPSMERLTQLEADLEAAMKAT